MKRSLIYVALACGVTALSSCAAAAVAGAAAGGYVIGKKKGNENPDYYQPDYGQDPRSGRYNW